MGNVAHKDQIGSEEGNLQLLGSSIQTNMIRMMNDDVFKKYKVVEVIGTGSMGFVAKARIREKAVGGSAFVNAKKKNRKREKRRLLKIPIRVRKKRASLGMSDRREEEVNYALKSIQVDRVCETFIEELRNEIDILRRMDHPNIVKPFEVYNSNHQIYMVLELCSGGDLSSRAPYSEAQSAWISGQILSAIKYMHDHGVVHRDLKFENIMWEDDEDDAEIRIIDFGLSKKFGRFEQDIMYEGVGTLYTMAPQVLQGEYTSQADMWSAGVIIYILLTTERPFPQRKRKELIDHIMRADYTTEGPLWVGLSDESKSIVRQLIEIDPDVRLDATDALKHPWLSMEITEVEHAPSAEVERRVLDGLRTYQANSALKKIALNVIAHKSTSKEIVELRRCFDKYDVSRDGLIVFDEFKKAMKESTYTDEEIEALFAGMDMNGDGLIQYTEFLAATLEARGLIEEERIAEAFDRLDANDTGQITKRELVDFLGEDASSTNIEELMEEWDADGDGMISYAEFKKMFMQREKSLKSVVHSEVALPSVDDNLV